MSAVKCLCPPCSCTKNTVRRHVTQFPLSVDCQPLRPTEPITRMALIVLLVEFLRWYLDVVWSGTWLSGAWSTTEACCFGDDDGVGEVVNMDGSGDLCCRGENSCREITATTRSADCSRAACELADITARDTQCDVSAQARPAILPRSTSQGRHLQAAWNARVRALATLGESQ